MEWFQMYVNDLSHRVLSAADDAAVGAWFRMLGNCYRLENGGCYEHCSQYSTRQWMSIACVDAEGVAKVVAAGLATWEQDNLRVHGYDIAQQQRATERKEKGREMALARWGHAASNAGSNATGNTKERRGKEIKEEEKKEDHSSPSSDGGKVETYSPSFLRFWDAWPKKVKKEDAWKTWRKQHCTEWLEAILAALAWQVKSGKWTEDGGQYIPHPDKYLRGKLWADDPSAYQRNGKPGNGKSDIRVGHVRAEDYDHSGPTGEVDLSTGRVKNPLLTHAPNVGGYPAPTQQPLVTGRMRMP
jgi:hypothetical protein